MGAIAFNGDIYPNGSSTAKDSVFDNTGTDLESTNAEDAIKEVDGKVEELSSNKQDKTDNSLATTDKTVVGAINEVNGNVMHAKVFNVYNAKNYKIYSPTALNRPRLLIAVGLSNGVGYSAISTSVMYVELSKLYCTVSWDSTNRQISFEQHANSSWSIYIFCTYDDDITVQEIS